MIKSLILNIFLNIFSKDKKIKFSIFLCKISRALLESGFNSIAEPKINGEYFWLKKYNSRLQNIIDAGANIGTWSENLLKTQSYLKNIIIIEPNEVLCELLSEKFEKDPRVIIECTALDYRKDRLFLNIQNDKHSQATVSATSNFPVNCQLSRKYINTNNLDNIIKKYAISQIDLLKLDVEGFENYALLGSRTLIRKGKIKLIQFEVTNAWETAGCSPCSIFRFLKNNNFIIYFIEPNGLKKLKNIDSLTHFSIYCNFLAIHKTVIKNFYKDVFN